MEQIGSLKLYSFEEMKDDLLGKIGSSERDEYERKVADDLRAYHLGEAVKKARKEQNLTQKQRGEKACVKSGQISRLERGHSVTLPTVSRVFQALGVATASLDLGNRFGKIALW